MILPHIPAAVVGLLTDPTVKLKVEPNGKFRGYRHPDTPFTYEERRMLQTHRERVVQWVQAREQCEAAGTDFYDMVERHAIEAESESSQLASLRNELLQAREEIERLKDQIGKSGDNHTAIPRLIIAADIAKNYNPPHYPTVELYGNRLLITVQPKITYECGTDPLKFIALVHHLSAKRWATRKFFYYLIQRTLLATGWKCHPVQPEF